MEPRGANRNSSPRSMVPKSQQTNLEVEKSHFRLGFKMSFDSLFVYGPDDWQSISLIKLSRIEYCWIIWTYWSLRLPIKISRYECIVNIMVTFVLWTSRSNSYPEIPSITCSGLYIINSWFYCYLPQDQGPHISRRSRMIHSQWKKVIFDYID